MALCEKCKSSNVIESDNGKYCCNCGWDSEKNDYVKKQTNADRIRAMSDEELAEYIVPRSFDCSDVCKEFDDGCMYNCTHGGGRKFILKWLQSEAE